ncbi:MAG: hypothetical protein CEE43_17990 [Promethearchaeota archaeon Loki_b32]|nr:MAG: hypothetical protein CEE43_17990 [Candidatus Lokiarchaeota archaeon Loki_b32]
MPSQTQVSGNLHTTYQNSLFDLHQMQADMKIQQESMTGEIVETVASSILLLLGAVGGGIFGSAGTSLGNIMVGFGTSVEGIISIKNIFKGTLMAHQVKEDQVTSPTSEIYNQELSKLYSQIEESKVEEGCSALTEEQKSYERQMENYIMLLQGSTRIFATVQLLDTGPPKPPITPINEISLLEWSQSRADAWSRHVHQHDVSELLGKLDMKGNTLTWDHKNPYNPDYLVPRAPKPCTI